MYMILGVLMGVLGLDGEVCWCGKRGMMSVGRDEQAGSWETRHHK
jgi:hypothetical protein